MCLDFKSPERQGFQGRVPQSSVAEGEVSNPVLPGKQQNVL